MFKIGDIIRCKEGERVYFSHHSYVTGHLYKVVAVHGISISTIGVTVKLAMNGWVSKQFELANIKKRNLPSWW